MKFSYGMTQIQNRSNKKFFCIQPTDKIEYARIVFASLKTNTTYERLLENLQKYTRFVEIISEFRAIASRNQ